MVGISTRCDHNVRWLPLRQYLRSTENNSVYKFYKRFCILLRWEEWFKKSLSIKVIFDDKTIILYLNNEKFTVLFILIENLESQILRFFFRGTLTSKSKPFRFTKRVRFLLIIRYVIMKRWLGRRHLTYNLRSTRGYSPLKVESIYFTIYNSKIPSNFGVFVSDKSQELKFSHFPKTLVFKLLTTVTYSVLRVL